MGLCSFFIKSSTENRPDKRIDIVMGKTLQEFFKKRWELIILIAFFGLLFLQLFSSHILLPANNGLYSSGSTWGDLPFHLTLINSFKERGLLTTLNQFPLYFGEKTRYPFVFDYLSAILLKLGLNLRWSIIIPSILVLIALIICLYYLALKISKRRLVGFFTPFLFIFNGSIFALYYFWKDFKKTNFPLFKFLNNLPIQYTHLSEKGIEFSNLVADFLLPQRTILLGLVFACLSLIFLWNYWETNDRKKLLKSAIVIGLMPLIHTHLFLSLILFSFFLFFIQWIYFKKFSIKEWFLWGVIVLVLAIGPVLWLFPFNNKSFFRVQLGWMANGEFFWWFWLKNLGLYLILLIFGFSIIKKYPHWNKIVTFYLPAFLIWIICNIFIFQPWEFDNMKIFIFWFLLSTIIIACYFDYLLRRRVIFKVLAVFLFLLIILPGFLAVFRELKTSYVLYTNSDLELANFVTKNTKTSDLFLTTDKHNNPISSLAGRQILMGYRGWLWSHGIDYNERFNDLLNIYNGSDIAYQLISKYAPNYILVEKKTDSQWLINYNYFKNHFRPVFENSAYILYKIEN